jgi:hypothetical protein
VVTQQRRKIRIIYEKKTTEGIAKGQAKEEPRNSTVEQI